MKFISKINYTNLFIPVCFLNCFSMFTHIFLFSRNSVFFVHIINPFILQIKYNHIKMCLSLVLIVLFGTLRINIKLIYIYIYYIRMYTVYLCMCVYYYNNTFKIKNICCCFIEYTNKIRDKIQVGFKK